MSATPIVVLETQSISRSSLYLSYLLVARLEDRYDGLSQNTQDHPYDTTQGTQARSRVHYCQVSI